MKVRTRSEQTVDPGRLPQLIDTNIHQGTVSSLHIHMEINGAINHRRQVFHLEAPSLLLRETGGSQGLRKRGSFR